ncbi:sensor histidine kinase [Paeniglutamicibacter sp. NPDC012692]|uniref:sensor histidine kinase n=1 Tax=Paeniglutamicibacter sp. NPDC012692 TaxID=3364388 RepID=UPI0036AA5032
MRSAILKFLLTGLVVLLTVSIPATFWVRSVAQNVAMQQVLELTQRLADYAIGADLGTKLAAGDMSAVEQINARMTPWMSDEMILRIKVWDSTGTILYSDVGELIGASFPLETWAEELLAGGPGVISLGPQEEGENIYEAGTEDLVEVYVLSGAGTDTPLLFEMYFHAAVVRVPEHEMLLGMIPVFLVALGVLQAAQLIPGIALAKRVQRYQRARRALLQQAIEAGEQERARLARDLHDDIIQDLAGLAYILDPSPSTNGSDAPSAILQGSIRKLREVTSELYSTPVSAAELPAALSVLVERTRSKGIRTRVDISEPVDLESRQATMLYRVGREALVNIMKHSEAKNVHLNLKPHGGLWTLRITDDGQGFDVLDGSRESHFGLRMMSDAAELVGARLELVSTTDGGTSMAVTTGGRQQQRGSQAD